MKKSDFSRLPSDAPDYPVWHPFTQHFNEKRLPKITGATDEFLLLESGEQLIDAISSWWTVNHGHGNKVISSFIKKQTDDFAQVMFSGFTHQPALDLAKNLLEIIPYPHHKVFFSDNGSTALEVGLKIALQFHFNRGSKRTRFIAFENAYHGDTFGSMSVSGEDTFTLPFSDLLFSVSRIPVPTPGNEEKSFAALSKVITAYPDQIAGFIFEPLVLGSGGMIMYEPEPLRKLIATCRSSEIVIISDEVMTGFGRTGKIFAGSYFEGMADVACFSKGLTGGFIPLGLTTATGEIFSAFLSEERKRMFLHGHSFSGNPIGCAAALGNLEVFKSGKSLKNIKRVSDFMMEFCGELEKTEGALNPRCLGTILAFEVNDPGADYFSDMRNRIYDFFMERGVFIRPLGNVIYLLPPYCISDKSLEKIRRAVLDFLISLRES